MYKYTKRLHNQTTDKTLFINIVHALIVIEKDITIKPMIDTPTFIKRFTKWLKNEGYTNINKYLLILSNTNLTIKNYL